MNSLNASLYIKNYKCFLDEPQGFSDIYPINIIIGRNNSGKSSLIEMLEYAISPEKGLSKSLNRSGIESSLLIEKSLLETDLHSVFKKGSYGGDIPGNDHWNDFGRKYIGAKIAYEQHKSERKLISITPRLNLVEYSRKNYEQKILNKVGNPLGGRIFKRLNAERNVLPEKENLENSLAADGAGFTNIVRRFINMDSLPSEMIEKTLLEEINKIVEPDMHFTDIVVQQSQVTGLWEIYLEEDTKGRISLGNSGSGIKTVFLVLAFIHLIPFIEGKNLDSYLFCFEELENNLHPALQRRLLMYLRSLINKNSFLLFLTTHSSVVIDLFNTDPIAQIIHVTHNGKEAVAKTTKAYFEHKGILSDLDVRASDLLQANCVIWVEGPSDRIYINKWIELYTNGSIKEGAHYQCVFYGGRLLAHLSAKGLDDEIEKAVAILRVNRNAVVVVDSDRTKNKIDINTTKKRMKDEVESAGGLAWITEGKEIENYIPPSVIEAVLSIKNLPKIEKWTDFSEYLEIARAGEGRAFERTKTLFAEKVSNILTVSDLETLNLKEMISDLVGKIRYWNSMPAPAAEK